MKTYLIMTSLAGSVILAGCYTELGTMRERSRDDDSYSNRQQTYEESEEDTTSSDSYSQSQRYDDYSYDRYDGYPRYRGSFSYYYPSSYWPSVGFTLAYNDPWYGWGVGYSCYDPWWCGTSYVMYPWPSYYYPPYYTYYPYYRYRYASGETVPRTNRDFGSTRGGSIRTGGRDRGDDRGSYVAPSTGSYTPGTGAARRGDTPTTTRPEARRGRRGEVGVSRTPSRDSQGSGTREGDRSGSRERSGQRSSGERRFEFVPRDAVPTPPARVDRPSEPQREQPRQSGSRRESEPQQHSPAPPTYSPPPPPQQNSGGSSGGRNSSEGGGRRGGRP